MHETGRSLPQRTIAVGLIGAALAFAVTGCGSGKDATLKPLLDSGKDTAPEQHAHRPKILSLYLDHPAVPRCFTAPQPDLLRKVEPPIPPGPANPNQDFDQSEAKYKRFFVLEKLYERARLGIYPPLRLKNSNLGFVNGDPIYQENIVNQTTKGLVEISTPEWKGTGFKTIDKTGRQVVVTAAHVLGNAKLSTLTITNDNGKKVHPISGCYIYEQNGKFTKLNPDSQSGVDVDLAVLVLPKYNSLGRTILEIANSDAKRSQWVTFVNYQADHEPGYPADYTGIVVTEPTDLSGYSAITGLEHIAKETASQLDDFQIQSGASGGPVVNSRGEVVGVSVAKTNDSYYLGRQYLKDVLNFAIKGARYGNHSGLLPVQAFLQSSSLVKKILSSPRG